MDFALNDEQQQIVDAIERLCQPFDADYWLKRDTEGGYPAEFHQALATAGWLGIAMPQAYGGSGLGIGEAALMMHTIAASGAGLSGASAVHMNIFGLQPAVVFGTEEQKTALAAAADPGYRQVMFRGHRARQRPEHPGAEDARGSPR